MPNRRNFSNFSSKLIEFLFLSIGFNYNNNVVNANYNNKDYRDVRTMRPCKKTSGNSNNRYCMSYPIAYFWNMSLSNILISIIAFCIFSFFAFFAFSRYSANNEQIFGFHNPLYQRVENSNGVTDGNGNLSNDLDNKSTTIEMQDLSVVFQDPNQGK